MSQNLDSSILTTSPPPKTFHLYQLRVCMPTPEGNCMCVTLQSKTVVLKQLLNHLKALLKQIAGLHPSVSALGGLRWGLIICMSDSHQGLQVWGPYFENHWYEALILKCYCTSATWEAQSTNSTSSCPQTLIL